MQLRLGSIPIRIHFWFIVMALLLGSNERNPAKLAMWVAIVAVSVVIHELGHALVGKAFGLIPSIELHGMGGTTSFAWKPSPDGSPRKPLGTLRNVAISLAGPFAGFFFALVIFGLDVAGLRPSHPLAEQAVAILLWVNVGWGIFNLLPMLPLDGGNVLRYVLIGLAREKGDKIARGISVVAAAAIALYALSHGQWWGLYLGALFAFRNIQALRQVGQQGRDEGLAAAIEGAYRAYDRSAWREVTNGLAPFLSAGAPATSTDLRSLAVRITVSAMLEDERLGEALGVIRGNRPLIPTDELQRYASRLREVGRPEDAAELDAASTFGAPATAGELKA